MQSYLGKYPGSRDDSDSKFIRAVNSFINQTDKDSELIIVSDGCSVTHGLYYDHFKNDDRIKYVYVDKDTPNMYEGQKKYYRGLPRQVGRSLVTGEVTTYMDSDDVILPNAIERLKIYWAAYLKLNTVALYNSTWIDNSAIIGRTDMMGDTNKTEGDPFEIEGLDSTWVLRTMNDPSLVLSSTWSMSHVSSFEGRWEDTVDSPSEDVFFSKKLQATKKVGVINIPYYVRCHYSDLWDF
jgi:glycosyltransferase involved in cell wall biosynthesis